MAAKSSNRVLEELWTLLKKDYFASAIVVSNRYIRSGLICSETNFWQIRGRCFLELNRLREAEQSTRAALKRVSQKYYRHVFCQLGEILARRGETANAAECFRNAIQYDRDHAQGYNSCGGLFALRGQLDKSEPLRVRAVACKAGVIEEAWLNLSFLRAAQERFADANRCLMRAIAIDYRYAEARKLLCELQEMRADASLRDGELLRKRIKRHHAARPIYTIAMARKFLREFDCSDAFILYVLGGAFMRVARYSEAESAFALALKLLPTSAPHIWHERALLFIQKGMHKKAEQLFARALKHSPDDPNTHREFGILRRIQGRNLHAKKMLHRATEIDPKNEENWSELGHYYRATERFRDAARCYRKSLKLMHSKSIRRALEDVCAAQRILNSFVN